ncbi:hypothetical protein L249_0178 [Ophiocordyceps polyrhachis-furcata BCC 54312]|uniref:Uncharacterized protein n=1 Tax=Ophiocordyceps polyrhachis-furcata BCC 54312 TaxID=1330021 RepID=A0A367LFK6_9HYPO|nr:hypothetical protein L249_0178 [Ophiocordyceps polyrhachis-furcata BCC 54312]
MRISKLRKPRPAIDPIKTNVDSAKKWVLTASRCQLCSKSPLPRSAITSPARNHLPPVDAKWFRAACDGPLTPRIVEPDKAEGATEGPRRGLPDTPRDDGLSAPPLTPLAHLTRRFQSFRVGLWQRGLTDFGRVDDDTFFVMPVALRQPTAVTDGDRLFISAVIHSKNRKPKGIKREFDLRQLRATVPEPLPSPRSPNFDRDSLLAAASTEEWMVSPSTPVSRGLVLTTTTGESQANPVPIHAPHARAHLPVLASILMSNLVQSGDKIDLPMPYPRAWTETAAYVYTGEEEMLTDEVKENIRYLGGRI